MSDTEPQISKEHDDDESFGSASSEHRIVLLGKTGSGKSSTGNTIMGQKNFKNVASLESVTKTCQRGEVQMGEQIISVIDTPGLFDKRMSQENLKTEIEKCINMSVPVPHVFLLVIRLDVKFTEEDRNSVRWIQENFGEEAARYTIILFTHADAQEDQSLDEYIRESDDLQAFVNECGGRFHSFNNKNMENRDQVTELMKKIEKMVDDNGGQHYTNEMYQKAQRRKKFWSENPRIVLLGETGSGKTSSAEIILDRDSFERRHLPHSATKTCEQQEAHVDGKSMKIIDTPGLTDEAEKMTSEIEKCFKISAPGPHVFLLVISLDERFTEEKNTVEWIQENFGEEVFIHTILLFTHTDALKKKPLDECITENNDLQALVNECGGRFHSFNNKNMENRSQVTELMEKIEKMEEENEWRHYTNEMYHDAQRKKQERQRFWSEKPRIVLLGKTRSGKSSAGNTIMGQERFKRRESESSATTSCKLHKAQVARKIIKIIDTPGLTDVSEEMKDEIENLVFMSAPGPHVFLLVIRLDVRFTEEDRNSVRWIQENFGEEAAHYTIILFTHADALKKKPLDEYISESNNLQALVNECGGRFHSFNNKNMENRDQVTELMKKIEVMVGINRGEHYTNEMYQNIQEKKQFLSASSELRIVLLGKTGAGKSSTGNTIMGQEYFENVAPLESVTKTCEVGEVETDERSVTVIDTPGLFDTTTAKQKTEIMKCVKMSAPGPHVFLLVIRLEERFTEEKNTVEWIQENFGEEVFNHTIILFSHTDALKKKPLDECITENNDLQALVNECGGRFHSFNNKNIQNRDQVTELMKKIEVMVEENEGQHYTNKPYQRAQRNKRVENLQIVLLGKTRSGKTSAVETILGRESFTKTCEHHEANVAGKRMKIIDTPGLSDVSGNKMKDEIENLVFMSAPGPHVFLLVIRLDEMFTEEKTVKWIQKNIGEEALHHTIILFTHADHLRGKPLDEYIGERTYLQYLVNSCDGRFHSFNNQDRDNQKQVTELLKKIEKMSERKRWRHYTNERFQEILKKKNKMTFDTLTFAEIACPPALLITLGGLAIAGAVGLVTKTVTENKKRKKGTFEKDGHTSMP